ncbi:MAG: tetratricopeptide repeat protein [Vulcanimicrobiaceae bacterium]|jgi:tetratricopeptide (TPR) repeat protein
MRLRLVPGLLALAVLAPCAPGAGLAQTTSTATLSQNAQQALQAGQYDTAASLYRQLVQLDPKQWRYQRGLGDALLRLGQYDGALAADDAALGLLQSAPGALEPRQRDLELGNLYHAEMIVYFKLKRPVDAKAAGERWAALSQSADAYLALCVIYYNNGEMDPSLRACDREIALDPTRPDAYFIKGSVIVASAAVGADGKLHAPAGGVEALRKYLELAPNGVHRADAQQMLDYLGSH